MRRLRWGRRGTMESESRKATFRPEKADCRSGKQALSTVVVTIVALAFCAFLWPALITFDPGDWPSPNEYPHLTPVHNACGLVGAWLAYQLRYWLGVGSFVLLAMGSIAVGVRLVRGRPGSPWERGFGTVLVLGCVAAFAHMVTEPTGWMLPVGHGGVIGFALGRVLEGHLHWLGSGVVLSAGLLVGLIFATNGWILRVPGKLGRCGHAMMTLVQTMRRFILTRVRAKARRLEEGVSMQESQALIGEVSEVEDEEEAEQEYEDEAEEVDEPVVVAPPSRRRKLTPRPEPQASARADAGPIVNFPSPRQEEAAEPYPREIENWKLPSPTLLARPEFGFSAEQENIVRKQAQTLEQTLEEFRLNARVVEIDTGPVITMFELKLGAGIKVSQIVTLSNDIARALRAPSIRVVAPISGKNTVGIEVPNVKKEIVRLHELLTVSGKVASDMTLPLFLGKDASGAALTMDLTTMPHLLIAGTTGSGKSVCLRAIILSILMTKRPDHVKLIIIDPKMVEMSQFKELPHLMCPIVTDVTQAERILEWAVIRMDERYELLAEARVKNIAGYNALGKEELYSRLSADSEQEKARVTSHLPCIVIIIDELSDLMMTAPREIENHLARLAQKSRAVGIHIIVATQRPEAKVVTGLIKSNLPSRICFRVASRMDSRIVLDQNGGEILMGQGDMLMLPPGVHKLVRAQGTYLGEDEVNAVLDDLKPRAEPEFHPDLIRLCKPAGEGKNAMRDPLFNDASRIVAETRRGSVSLLQRRLGVGYSRASRLIEQMAQAGLVGDHKGSQAREVFMSAAQWDALLAQSAAEEAEEETMEAAKLGIRSPTPSRQAGSSHEWASVPQDA